MIDFTPVLRLYGIVVLKIGTLSRWTLTKHKSRLKAETFLWLVAKDEIRERCFVWPTEMQTSILWPVHRDHMARNCRQLLIAGKRGLQCYNHKAMNFAHIPNLEDDPECQVKTAVLVNTSGSVLWILELMPATLCWDFWSTETEIINGCKIGGFLL